MSTAKRADLLDHLIVEDERTRKQRDTNGSAESNKNSLEERKPTLASFERSPYQSNNEIEGV